MTSLDSLFCPCCTGTLLQTLVGVSTTWGAPKLFLELGKGALLAAMVKVEPTEEKIPFC